MFDIACVLVRIVGYFASYAVFFEQIHRTFCQNVVEIEQLHVFFKCTSQLLRAFPVYVFKRLRHIVLLVKRQIFFNAVSKNQPLRKRTCDGICQSAVVFKETIFIQQLVERQIQSVIDITFVHTIFGIPHQMRSKYMARPSRIAALFGRFIV